MSLTERYVNHLADKVASGVSFMRLARMEDAVGSVGKAGLNIRVPFCALRCDYCALPGMAYSEKATEAFLNGLFVELGLYSEYLGNIDIDRVYLSGGTPSLLHKEIPTILKIVEDRFGKCGKVAIEASPTDLSGEVIESLRASGVTQISIGVQTFDERMLKEVLNRKVEREQMVKTLDKVVESGFDYVNIDLMFSLPGQDRQSLANDLKVAVETGVQGISTYPLMLLPYTPMTMRLQKEGEEVRNGPESKSNEDENYLTIVRNLRERGYKLRTLWSFSTKPEQYEGPYEHSNFIGIGPKAWGLLGDRMTLNVPNVFDYVRRLDEGFIPVFAYSPVSNYPLSKFARQLYYGKIDLSELNSLIEQDGQVRNYVRLMRILGLTKRQGNMLVLTDKALVYGNMATKKIAMATLSKIDEIMRTASKIPTDSDLEMPQIVPMVV